MAAINANTDGLRERALRLLGQREHTRLELARKLTGGGNEPPGLSPVLDALEADDYLSDERFAEVFVRSRVDRGQGPLKIRAELAGRGVADRIADDALAHTGAFWVERAQHVRQRKFGDEAPAARGEWNRQARFLAQRGFPSDVIYRALDSVVA